MPSAPQPSCVSRNFSGSAGAVCRGVLQELDSVVTRTRMFQYKPDGEVTFRMAQDAVGLPAPLMQDPIHYPHGTKFMAPGLCSAEMVQACQVRARRTLCPPGCDTNTKLPRLAPILAVSPCRRADGAMLSTARGRERAEYHAAAR